MMKISILWILAFSIGVGNALAQNTEEDLALAYGDKESVSIATGSKQLLRHAPSVATVITAEDIKEMGATSLDDVMESVPGVHVTRSAASYFSIYSIRGIGNQNTNPQVLMLQNGIPTNSIYRGDRGQSMGAPLLENVERIEIIRGPGSALYGADAFSGVVNIITKKAENINGAVAGARAGSFGSQDAWVQHGGKWGGLNVEAYLQVGRSNGAGQTITADAATRLNRLFNNQSSYAPGAMNTGDKVVDAQLDIGHEKWRFRSGYKRRKAGAGAGVSYALDPAGWEKTQHIDADLSWEDAQFTRGWGLGFTASYLQHDEDNSYRMYPPGTILPAYTVSATTPAAVLALLGNPAIGTVIPGTFANGMMGTPSRKERQFRLSGHATYSSFADHSIRLGAGHEDLNMYQITTLKNFWLRTDGPAALIGVPVLTGALIDYSAIQPHLLPHRRFNDYAYVQDEWNFARDWSLTAGIRHDDFSDFGSTTNPRLALVWDAYYNFTAKLMYGQAFRAPSFNEQYGVNPTGDGNPNVKPERIKTMEAAVSWQAREDTKLNLNLFHNIIRNMISPVAKPGGVGAQFTNVGNLHGNGMEFEAQWEASRNVRVTANLSLQQTIDENTNTDAGYVPHKHAFARAAWRMAGNWMLSPQVDWVADRRRATGDTRPPVPDYTIMDLTLNTKNDRWEYSASVRNIFNATALEPSLAPGTAIPYDLPVAPRTIWLQAVLKL